MKISSVSGGSGTEMGNEQSAGGVRGTLPQGMQAMGSQLQKKFAKGVQYNSKNLCCSCARRLCLLKLKFSGIPCTFEFQQRCFCYAYAISVAMSHV